MRIILEIQPGSAAPRSVEIAAGSELRVGRSAPAQLILADDRSVSRLHFSVAFDGQVGRIRDLGSSHGTMVNDTPITEAILHDGDLIRAGATRFRVCFAERLPGGQRPSMVAEQAGPEPAIGVGTADPPIQEASLHDRVIGELRSLREPLFASLDAARDPRILALLADCQLEHKSLYEGTEGERLMAVAPYLVLLPRGSSFLETIVRGGWGESWGIFLTCHEPFEGVRKHLRHFLTVQLEGGDPVYFRFYDPRVLRDFVPTCTSEEVRAFFGPIRGFYLESKDPGTLLRFESRAGKLERHETRLLEPAMSGSHAGR